MRMKEFDSKMVTDLAAKAKVAISEYREEDAQCMLDNIILICSIYEDADLCNSEEYKERIERFSRLKSHVVAATNENQMKLS